MYNAHNMDELLLSELFEHQQLPHTWIHLRTLLWRNINKMTVSYHNQNQTQLLFVWNMFYENKIERKTHKSLFSF